MSNRKRPTHQQALTTADLVLALIQREHYVGPRSMTDAAVASRVVAALEVVRAAKVPNPAYQRRKVRGATRGRPAGREGEEGTAAGV